MPDGMLLNVQISLAAAPRCTSSPDSPTPRHLLFYPARTVDGAERAQPPEGGRAYSRLARAPQPTSGFVIFSAVAPFPSRYLRRDARLRGTSRPRLVSADYPRRRRPLDFTPRPPVLDDLLRANVLGALQRRHLARRRERLEVVHVIEIGPCASWSAASMRRAPRVRCRRDARPPR